MLSVKQRVNSDLFSRTVGTASVLLLGGVHICCIYNVGVSVTGFT